MTGPSTATRAHLVRLLRRFLCEHNICSHGVLRPAYEVVTGVEEEAVLKHEYATVLGHDIQTLLHAIGVKRGGTAFEWLLPSAILCIVEVEVQCKIRTLLAIWCLICAVTMCCVCQHAPARKVHETYV